MEMINKRKTKRICVGRKSDIKVENRRHERGNRKL